MIRILAIQAVVVGILVPTGPAYAESMDPDLGQDLDPHAQSKPEAKAEPKPEKKIVKAGWEQGRPLWSLCEPRSKRAAAATPLKGQRQGPVAPSTEIGPSWSDCEGIGGVDRAVFDPPARSSGGMSSQFDDEDEAPICDGGTRCIPVPTERSQVVSGLTFAKAIAPPAATLRPITDSYTAPPASIGMADDGYPSAPFVPPQPAV